MDCLYAPDLHEDSTIISVEKDEVKHAKSLRLKLGERVLLSSGTGLIALCTVQSINHQQAVFSIHEIRKNIHELPGRFAIAIGILHHKERMEYMIEKLTELGITDFYPLISTHAESHSCDEKRLMSKMVSALKQCKRSVLPVLHKPITINDLHTISTQYTIHILADPSGKNSIDYPQFTNTNNNSIIAFIGPEGGFSAQELQIISSIPTIQTLSLGNRRLRAETAAIAVSSIIQYTWQ